MEVIIKAVKGLIEERFRGNMTWFSEEIGVDYSYVNQILNGHRNAKSKKFCDAIIKYCNKNNLNYKDYIFLP